MRAVLMGFVVLSEPAMLLKGGGLHLAFDYQIRDVVAKKKFRTH
jgi:hypothetical protein